MAQYGTAGLQAVGQAILSPHSGAGSAELVATDAALPSR